MSKAADTETTGRKEQAAGLGVRRVSEALVVVLKGDWTLQNRPPAFDPVAEAARKEPRPVRMEFDCGELGEWDSALLNLVLKCHALCREQKIQFAGENLPPGARKLLDLALAVPEAATSGRRGTKPDALTRLGAGGIRAGAAVQEFLTFLGGSALAALRLPLGAAQFRWPDAMLVMQRAGPEALGVVALINFLVGVILAFVGAVQLSRFGAAIFVADLVAIGTVREMGCLMTGIIVCGRTGAAFAAELGAMKANEEISAFRSFGISPMEFLVLPRILGLFLMMPLLTVFADLIAITGGFLVSISMLDVTAIEYLRRSSEAITLTGFLLGIFKSAVFGIIIALFGCLRGMQSGENAAAVGRATTSAVVSGITCIVAADGVFAVLCNALGI